MHPAPRADDEPLLLGGRWKVRFDRPMGEGTFSRVFACEDLRMDARAGADEAPLLRAANLLKPDAPPDLTERIPATARLTAHLDDPAIIHTLDFGTDGRTGGAWFVSELCEHPTVERWVRGVARHDPADALRIGRAVAAALARVRARYYARCGPTAIHRDISPGNIYVVCDRLPNGTFGPARDVKIGDWTLARRPGWRVLTEIETGEIVVGTPGFRAPEVLRREPPTAASDLYSIGALIHYADTSLALPEGVGPTELPDSALPARARRYVLTMLAHDPRRRPAGEAEAAEALGRLLGRRAGGPSVAPAALALALASAALWLAWPRPGPVPAAAEPPRATWDGREPLRSLEQAAGGPTAPPEALLEAAFAEAEARLAAAARAADEAPARSPPLLPPPGREPEPISSAPIRAEAGPVRSAMERLARASWWSAFDAREPRRRSLADEAEAWDRLAEGRDDEVSPATPAFERAVARRCLQQAAGSRDLLAGGGLALWGGALDGRAWRAGPEGSELAPLDHAARPGARYVRLAVDVRRAGPRSAVWFVLDAAGRRLEAPIAGGRRVVELVGLGDLAVLRVDGEIRARAPWSGRGAAWPRAGMADADADLLELRDF